jgi:hypothetical protein
MFRGVWGIPPTPYTPYAMHIFGHIRVSIVLERSSYREDASSVVFTLISDSVLEKALRPDIKEQKTCSIQLFGDDQQNIYPVHQLHLL